MGSWSTPARRLAVWSALGALGLVAVYLLTVRLAPGQRLDDLALEGRKATSLTVRRSFTAVMHVVTPIALMALGSLIVVVSARRGTWRTAAVSALALLGAVVAARLLKGNLPRTDMLDFSYARPENTLPSGHSTVATTIALLLITVSSTARRPQVCAAALLLVVLHSLAVLGSGWHRPSDVLGGIALGVVFAGAASAGMAFGCSGGQRASQMTWYEASGVIPKLLLDLLVLSTVAALWVRNRVVNPAHPFGAYLVAILLTSAVAALAVLVHARLLGGFDFRADAGGVLEVSGERREAERPDQS